MATQCSILAGESPWTEEPGGLQSMGVTNQQQQAAVLLGSYDPTDPMTIQCSMETVTGYVRKNHNKVSEFWRKVKPFWECNSPSETQFLASTSDHWTLGNIKN